MDKDRSLGDSEDYAIDHCGHCDVQVTDYSFHPTRTIEGLRCWFLGFLCTSKLPQAALEPSGEEGFLL